MQAPGEVAAFATLAHDILSLADEAKSIRYIHKLRIVGVGDGYSHLVCHIIKDGLSVYNPVVRHRNVSVANLYQVVYHLDLGLTVGAVNRGAYIADDACED